MADHANDAPVVTSALLPDALASRLDHPSAVVGWAEFDLDVDRRFSEQFAVLTDSDFILVGKQVEQIALSKITEAAIDESIGSDRLVIAVEGELPRILRYSRRCRRDMSRLNRLLNRRIKKEAEPTDNGALPWLDKADQTIAAKQICPKCKHTIPDYAEGVCPSCLQRRQILWRLLDVAKPYRVRIWVALGATLLLAITNAMLPRLNAHLIDDGVSAGDVSALMFWGKMLFVVILLTECFAGLRLRMLARVGSAVSRDLRHNVYQHMQSLSMRFFSKRRTGSLITRVTSDTERLWDFIVFGTVDSIRNVLMIGLLAVNLLLMNWQLSLIAIAPLPFVAGITYFRSKRMHKLFSRMWIYYSRMSGIVGDAVPGIKVVKAFANEDREVSRFDARSTQYMDKELEVNRAWVTMQPIVGILMRASGVVVWLVGGYLVIQHKGDTSGKWTIGTLVAFTQSLWMFYQPIMELSNSGRMVTRAASSAQRVFEVLDTPPEVYSMHDAYVPTQWQPRVEFRNVSFSYEGAQPALREVSLKIEPGQMIGLCGHSGAGKSTFVNLLCRFYDVTDGQILIDGVDVREYDLKWLRKHIGIVLQEPYLFHGTIADNIKYGNPDATPQQIMSAARAANAHDFIVGLPDGYDTIVGERGQSLSGGERQRVSIARAILHDPQILILDEATSSVDTRTEKMIQQALDRLVEGRTTFAIAHRLTTLQNANLLVVLDKGKIAETGTHSELIARPDGQYAKLHQMQAELNSVMAFK
jgi:ATP-binding cassette subfamily B protein